ncbi:MAG TPA: hypothetical protein VF988_11695, partial [Verrucomicrobiae bacterium]
MVLCFIGIGSAERSEERVAMHVSQGGHDVPTEKLMARYPRTMANLRQAIEELPLVIIFDNDDLARPYRLVAVFQNRNRLFSAGKDPRWLLARIFHRHPQAKCQGHCVYTSNGHSQVAAQATVCRMQFGDTAECNSAL